VILQVVNEKRRWWLAAALALAICGAAAWALSWYRGRAPSTTQGMLARLRPHDAAVVQIDFAGLRRGGVLDMLAGSKAAQDPEYLEFVRKTGFDYSRDVDLALACFAPRTSYFLVKGRFDWTRLRAYAESSGGSCDRGGCRMPGSTPERNISYTLLAGHLLALAVGPDPAAVAELQNASAESPAIEIPAEPVWIYLPPAALTSTASLPSGTRMFARGLEKAESCVLSFGPEGKRFAAKLRVKSRSAEDAAGLVESLERATALLGQMVARESHAPNPRDLSGVLTAGAFRRQGANVFGYWPLERGFVEELLAEPAR
jgi:hypothetical protein